MTTFKFLSLTSGEEEKGGRHILRVKMMKWFESIFERGSQSQWAARRRQSDHFFGQNFQSRGEETALKKPGPLNKRPSLAKDLNKGAINENR